MVKLRGQHRFLAFRRKGLVLAGLGAERVPGIARDRLLGQPGMSPQHKCLVLSILAVLTKTAIRRLV